MHRCWAKRRSVRSLSRGWVLAMIGIVAAIGVASGTATASPLGVTKVVSSLNGQSVLPSRLHWTATVSPSAGVTSVDFLIDGKVAWIEHTAPYVYGGDDNGTDLGWLITTWLTPGTHQFTVRAMTAKGAVENTTRARVTAAPEPPAALTATWTRSLTTADQNKAEPQYGGPPPVGVWHLVFDQIGVWELDPMGSGVVNQYTVSGHTLMVYAPIWMAPNGVSRFGHTGIGGNDCTQAGPFGSYTWTVSGSELTLRAKNEACGDRQAVLEGTWTRVG
jgi:hypothetical protein